MNDSKKTNDGLSYATLKKAFTGQSLFKNKTWRYSPKAFELTAEQVREIHIIGKACNDFYHAQEVLYLRSAEDKNLMRNNNLRAPWVAEYLDLSLIHI